LIKYTDYQYYMIMNFIIRITILTFLIVGVNQKCFTQVYPFYNHEKQVSIIGLTEDAMEPFISLDGDYLFFNNLNDGINTRLYYAERLNDSTFNFIGELNGTNQTVPPHLDAVAGLDSLNNFFWVSLREYPLEFDNLFHGEFTAENVTNIGRMHGDFYIYAPGWILMDHGISYNGQFMYFNNARFEDCPGPCETRIGVAQKENDSTYTMLENSTQIMQSVNDTNYKNYAPAVTKDELELYYTRFLKGPITQNSVSEICVVVRNSPTDNFSVPQVLFSGSILNSFIEAPTITTDKQIMYYHKKIDGIYRIMMRTRDQTTGIPDYSSKNSIITIIPNPMHDKTIIKIGNPLNTNYSLHLMDGLGRLVRNYTNVSTGEIEISRGDLSSGIFIIRIFSNGKLVASRKLIIE